MDLFMYLTFLALFTGFIWFLAFVWSVKHGQFEDMEGASHRILIEDDDINDTGEENKLHSSKVPPQD